ncbi:MAG TPA: lytic transglycosylase domain-containing protein [Burkholderiales bacterium]|jgi:soluble lytic murein transglycosylase-like protein|nr:lytic transglycosylase domain-containing protein [Burkholderiales bacterium]
MTARRRLAVLAGFLLAAPALAGEQRYEPLSASVRANLHRSVADQASPRRAFFDGDDGAAWLAEMSRKLVRHMPDAAEREMFLTTVHYEASRAGLDPQMVLGVIQVESRFRKYAVSRAGARGYMQVMPFWVELIGEERQNLFSLRTNLRYGCTILRHYLDIERGNLFRALGRYNGTLGKSKYPEKVLQAWRERWDYPDSGVKVKKATADAPVPGRATRRAPTVYMGDG